MLRRITTLLLAAMIAFTATAAIASGIENPVRDVTAEEMLEETGVSFPVPQGARDVSYAIIEIEGEGDISQVQFTMDGILYCCRIQMADAPNDISGMHYDWTAEATVQLPYWEAVARYIEGEAGVIQWYNILMGLNCSVSMDTGASEAALTGVAEPIAAEQTQEAG